MWGEGRVEVELIKRLEVVEEMEDMEEVIELGVEEEVKEVEVEKNDVEEVEDVEEGREVQEEVEVEVRLLPSRQRGKVASLSLAGCRRECRSVLGGDREGGKWL